MSATLYAKAGEVVTCETCETPLGHFCVDVYRGSNADSQTFVLPNGEHPKRNAVMPSCPVCGGRGFRGGILASLQAHFTDGWRGVP